MKHYLNKREQANLDKLSQNFKHFFAIDLGKQECSFLYLVSQIHETTALKATFVIYVPIAIQEILNCDNEYYFTFHFKKGLEYQEKNVGVFLDLNRSYKDVFFDFENEIQSYLDTYVSK